MVQMLQSTDIGRMNGYKRRPTSVLPVGDSLQTPSLHGEHEELEKDKPRRR